jgi:hypothetical protein
MIRTSKLATFVIVLSAAAMGLSACSGPKEKWIDQAAGHDGRSWTVRRTVEFTFGGGDLSQAFTRWPNKFSLELDDPASGKTVSWHGEKYVNPVLLDMVEGVPWLVVNGNNLNSDVERYGCPDLPYAFLRFDAAKSRWIPVPAKDAPAVLRTANLSYSWEAYLMERQRTQTPADIASLQASSEQMSGFFFSREIPRTYADWKYQYKKQYATRARAASDCRAPLAQPVDAIFPNTATMPSQPVRLEILEEKRHAPVWTIKGNPGESEPAWSRYAWDQARHDACKAYVRPADPEDERLVSWNAFIAEPARMFAPGHMICDADAIWFYSYVAEAGRVVIVKTTTRGEVLYRVSFPKPDEPDGYQGAIMNPTLRAADGYLGFEWWNSNQSGHDVLVNRAMKVRIREPQAP